MYIANLKSAIADLPSKLTRTQAPSFRTHYLLDAEELRSLHWDGYQTFAVLSRSQLSYSLIDASAIPADARDRYFALQAMRQSPWSDFSYHIEGLASGRASLWIWDAQWEQRMRGELPAEAATARLLPETLLHPQGDTGAYLRPCSSGYEFQVWEKGCLTTSRWLPDKPTAAELSLILRSERGGQISACEENVEWLSRPWCSHENRFRDLWRDDKNVQILLASVLVFFVSLELGRALVTSFQSSWTYNQIDAMQQGMHEEMQIRSRAERQRELNSQWLSVYEPHSQLDVVSDFNDAMRDTGYKLVEWEYNSGQLKVVIFDEDINRRDVVSRLAAKDLFVSPRIEPGIRDGESVISIQLPDMHRYRELSQ